MSEWILVMAVFLMQTPGQTGETPPVIVTGFTSQITCTKAAASISNQYYGLFKIAGKTLGANRPDISFNCLQINK